MSSTDLPPNTSSPRIVAIDGPSGVGKSTAARELARRLDVPYLDTGAMYRTLALAVLREGIDPADESQREAMVSTARNAEVSLAPDGAGAFEVRLDGVPVGDAIRTQKVGEAASRVSAHPAVRERMVELQRQAAAERGGVLEGRDIGTVVFPDTPYKFYVDARPEVRYRRRFEELQQRGEAVTLDEVAAAMERRDAQDQNRATAPLTLDDRYTFIDTSDRDVSAVVESMLKAIQGGGVDAENVEDTEGERDGVTAGPGDRRDRMGRFAVVVAGGLLLLAGFGNLDAPSWLTRIWAHLSLLAAAAHFVVAIRWQRWSRNPAIQRLLALVAGIILAVEGAMRLEQGKTGLPWALFVGAALYLLVAIFYPQIRAWRARRGPRRR